MAFQVPEGGADWVQAQAAMRANDLAAQALQVAWASAIVNALVVIAAFVVPWWQMELQRRMAESALRRDIEGDVVVAIQAANKVVEFLELGRLEERIWDRAGVQEDYAPVLEQLGREHTAISERIAERAELDGPPSRVLTQMSTLIDEAMSLIQTCRMRTVADEPGGAPSISSRAGEASRAEWRMRIDELALKANRLFRTIRAMARKYRLPKAFRNFGPLD